MVCKNLPVCAKSVWTLCLFVLQVSLGSLFKDIKLSDAKTASLSLVHDGEAVADQKVKISPMEIEAYKVKLS